METREGKLVVDEAGHELYYRLLGTAEETLVILHGGPGVSHSYLNRMGELAGNDLRVVFYDQLGSGKSDKPEDKSLYYVQRYSDDLEVLLKKLGLGRVHLYGQSWGGMLALQYSLDHPERVISLILSDTAASTRGAVRGMKQRLLELPPQVYHDILKLEGAGDFTSKEYADLVLQFYCRFLRRSTPFDPERSLREYLETAGEDIEDLGPGYYNMWGPNEFTCTGAVLDWDVVDRLGEIHAPTLIVCGWYDEAVPELHRELADRIPDNEYVVFGNSSHLIIQEKEANAYLAVIRDFIRRHRSS